MKKYISNASKKQTNEEIALYVKKQKEKKYLKKNNLPLVFNFPHIAMAEGKIYPISPCSSVLLIYARLKCNVCSYPLSPQS